jgi:hypothetical protein
MLNIVHFWRIFDTHDVSGGDYVCALIWLVVIIVVDFSYYLLFYFNIIVDGYDQTRGLLNIILI